MNCESAQREILLDSSGELSAGRQPALRRHLAGCDNCRNYKLYTENLVALASRALPDAHPSSTTLERIIDEGNRATRRQSLYIFGFHSRSLLAAAAGLMIVAAASCLLVVANRRMNSEAHGRRVSQMNTIIAMVAEDESVASEAAVHGNHRPDMRALSMQILAIEGLVGEEPAEGDEIILDDDDQPRDLQSHSTCDSRPAECV